MTDFRLSNPSIVVQFISMSKVDDCNRKSVVISHIWLFQEELENLKNKFEKLEQEKLTLKLETSKLEAKVSYLE